MWVGWLSLSWEAWTRIITPVFKQQHLDTFMPLLQDYHKSVSVWQEHCLLAQEIPNGTSDHLINISVDFFYITFWLTGPNSYVSRVEHINPLIINSAQLTGCDPLPQQHNTDEKLSSLHPFRIDVFLQQNPRVKIHQQMVLSHCSYAA